MNPIQPAGITPASLWDPADPGSPLLPDPILAPHLDPSTGERLDLTTSADPVIVAIGQALRTRRGSGVAVEDDGNLLAEIRKNSPDAPALIEYELRRMLKPWVDGGDIEILAISVTAGPDQGVRGSGTVRVRLLHAGGAPIDIPV